MANVSVDGNDHGGAVITPLSDLLWKEITKLRQEIVQLNSVIKELKEAGYADATKRADQLLNRYANKEARGGILDKYIDNNDNILLDKKNEVKKK